MFFLGLMTVGYVHSADITPTDINNISVVTIKNQICDELLITKDTSSFVSPLNSVWNSETLLDAKFENSLIAGNVSLMLSQIDNLRIRRREVNSYTYTVLADIPITKASDLLFSRYDRFARATTYQYDLVTMLNGVEGAIVSNTIESSFDDFYIMEKDTGYHGINIEITPTRNQNSTVITPLDGKYPVVIYNTSMNYDSLNIKGMFIQLVNGEFDKAGAWKYRDSMKDFLVNHKPKIIKYSDGRIWLVSIVDNPSDDSSNYNAEGYTIMTFSAISVGDASDSQTLFEAGLIDINQDYYY